MYQPSPLYVGTIRVIDAFTRVMGMGVAALMIPLVIGVSYEVFSRYVLNDPTIWAFDLTYMIYGTVFMLGASFALMKGAHIRTDMLWQSFSDRTKGLIDCIAYVAFFFPAMTFLFYASFDNFWDSFLINERSEQTAWRPLIWPFKGVIPLTCVLLAIQGVSEFLKSLYAVRAGREYEHHEHIQV
jgi:TRAP-type mannitol/chloroaromatic compound transport system permease small subunit